MIDRGGDTNHKYVNGAEPLLEGLSGVLLIEESFCKGFNQRS